MTEEELKSEAKEVNERCEILIKECIAPILRNAGFRQKGKHFHRNDGEIEWCIHIQKDGSWYSYEVSRSVQFTINIGVTYKEHYLLLLNENQNATFPGFLHVAACPFRARIGEFTEKKVHWFSIHPKDDDTMLKEHIQRVLVDSFLPKLAHIRSKYDLFQSIRQYPLKQKNLLCRLFSRHPAATFFTPSGGYSMLILYHSLGMQNELEKEIGRLKDSEFVNKEELQRILNLLRV